MANSIEQPHNFEGVVEYTDDETEYGDNRENAHPHDNDNLDNDDNDDNSTFGMTKEQQKKNKKTRALSNKKTAAEIARNDSMQAQKMLSTMTRQGDDMMSILRSSNDTENLKAQAALLAAQNEQRRLDIEQEDRLRRPSQNGQYFPNSHMHSNSNQMNPNYYPEQQVIITPQSPQYDEAFRNRQSSGYM